MKLLIDIGNTNTSVALSQGKKIHKVYFIHTSKKQVGPAAFKRMLGKHLKYIESVVVVSVVPKFLAIINKNLKSILPAVPVRIVGKNIKVPIPNKYKDPLQVGQDRLVLSYAAMKKYGTPVVVVDFGTAVTMDVVTVKGEYEGGLIFPGMRLALGSLSRNAALLPKAVDLKPTRGLVGRDTVSSMNNGILYGYAAMCDGMIDLLRKRYGNSLKVIATGGDAALVARYSQRINKTSPRLIFFGLELLSE